MISLDLHNLHDVRLHFSAGATRAPVHLADAAEAWVTVEVFDELGNTISLVLDDPAAAEKLRSGARMARDYLRNAAELALADNGDGSVNA